MKINTVALDKAISNLYKYNTKIAQNIIIRIKTKSWITFFIWIFERTNKCRTQSMDEVKDLPAYLIVKFWSEERPT